MTSHLAPNSFLSIMGYLMTVSEKTCHEDLKTENVFKIG